MKNYRKYLTHGQDNNDILYYTLQQAMREEQLLQVTLSLALALALAMLQVTLNMARKDSGFLLLATRCCTAHCCLAMSSHCCMAAIVVVCCRQCHPNRIAIFATASSESFRGRLGSRVRRQVWRMSQISV